MLITNKTDKMKTFAQFLTMVITIIGWYQCLFTHDFLKGFIIMIFGALCFLIISYKTEKIKGYDSKHFMNR